MHIREVPDTRDGHPPLPGSNGAPCRICCVRPGCLDPNVWPPPLAAHHRPPLLHMLCVFHGVCLTYVPVCAHSGVQLELDAINHAVVHDSVFHGVCLTHVPVCACLRARACGVCVQLELDAINRIVTVKKEDVLGKAGQPALAGRGGYGFNPNAPRPPGGYGFVPGGVPRTPAHVMATPMHPSMGGSTPIHPSRVRPAWLVGHLAGWLGGCVLCAFHKVSSCWLCCACSSRG